MLHIPHGKMTFPGFLFHFCFFTVDFFHSFLFFFYLTKSIKNKKKKKKPQAQRSKTSKVRYARRPEHGEGKRAVSLPMVKVIALSRQQAQLPPEEAVDAVDNLPRMRRQHVSGKGDVCLSARPGQATLRTIPSTYLS